LWPIAARVAEGVLGPFFDCEVFRTLKRPTTKSVDTHDFRPWHFDEIKALMPAGIPDFRGRH